MSLREDVLKKIMDLAQSSDNSVSMGMYLICFPYIPVLIVNDLATLDSLNLNTTQLSQ